MPENRVFRLLHVEDDDDHHELFRLALLRDDDHVQLERACDGSAALACLSESSPFPLDSPPDLVVLDLKIPAPDGHAVLAFLKNSPRLRRIPVVVLSTSASESDIRRALAASANAYVTKPTSVIAFERLAADLRRFWQDWNTPDPDRDLALRN